MRLLYIFYILSILILPGYTENTKNKYWMAPGSPIKGTFFFGGAGLSSPYIPELTQALQAAGIKSAVYLELRKWSSGEISDVLSSLFFVRNYNPHFSMLLRISIRKNRQFNLIGYSYGSLLASQLAAKYALGGTTVDHLVLIGSPISKHFLGQIKKMKLIKKVIVINLSKYGDPIYAGIGTIDLIFSLSKLSRQMEQSEGHFYYTVKGVKGDKRREKLAKYLFRMGLR